MYQQVPSLLRCISCPWSSLPYNWVIRASSQGFLRAYQPNALKWCRIRRSGWFAQGNETMVAFRYSLHSGHHFVPIIPHRCYRCNKSLYQPSYFQTRTWLLPSEIAWAGNDWFPGCAILARFRVQRKCQKCSHMSQQVKNIDPSGK